MKATFARVPYDEYQERRQDLYEKETQVITKKEGQLQEKKERWAKIYQGVKDDQDQCVRDPETGRLLKKRMKRLLVGKKAARKKRRLPSGKSRKAIRSSISFSPYPRLWRMAKGFSPFVGRYFARANS
jgi:hypothetical protein